MSLGVAQVALTAQNPEPPEYRDLSVPVTPECSRGSGVFEPPEPVTCSRLGASAAKPLCNKALRSCLVTRPLGRNFFRSELSRQVGLGGRVSVARSGYALCS
jgi:hypothetical protein